MKPRPGTEEYDDLWHSFKNGDRAAFETIYKQQVRGLLNYGYKVTSDRSLIEDSIQDLFVDLWQNRHNISETTSIKFYLFKALRYKIGRNYKTIEKVDFQNINHLQELVLPHENFLMSTEVHSDQMKHLKELIEKLPKRQQEAINLRYFHNFSNEEIAHIMGVNYQSACKFIYTALRKLKLNLKVSVACFLILIIFF